MGWRDYFTDSGDEPEDRTFTFTGFSTPKFEQALADMRRHFGDDDPDDPLGDTAWNAWLDDRGRDWLRKQEQGG
ncbi:MAG TPA: hypothetical protein VG276_28740 [Actinomycetes bacterium]|jgi:hypothetical protein|nr:hypothetical protein [Actinomycetes bacterium]